MTLWQQFNSIHGEDNFHDVYSLPEDTLVICLRVVFAKWIEKSIGKISPRTFVRALTFSITRILRSSRRAIVPVDIINLCHSSKLYAYLRLLQQNYQTPHQIASLYWKFVECLHKECCVLKIRDMEDQIPTELFSAIENLREADLFENNPDEMSIELCKQTISNVSTRFRILQEELQLLVHNAKEGFQLFDRQYLEYQCIQGAFREIENDPNGSLMIIIAKDLLEIGYKILMWKGNIQLKLAEIRDTASTFIVHLQRYLHLSEKLHVFSRRGVKRNTEAIETKAENILLFLQAVCNIISNEVNGFNYERIRRINYDVILITNAGNDHGFLLNVDSYRTNFGETMTELHNLQLSIYKSFTLIIDLQPPSVMIKGSPRPISLRLFNLHNVLARNFEIKVYLVNEDTVRLIHSQNEIPDYISAIDPQSKARDIAGDIAITDPPEQPANVDGPHQARRRPRRKVPDNDGRRHRTSQDAIDSLPGFSVVPLKGKFELNEQFYCFDKQFIVKTINRTTRAAAPLQHHRRPRGRQPTTSGSSRNSNSRKQARGTENVTNDKVALLFVTEISFQNDVHKVWAISLPMILAAHGSQNEKAYATMAWDDVLYAQTRNGFEVPDNASWVQISAMLKGTFETLVDEPLKLQHLEYLRKKIELNIGRNIEKSTKISKADLCDPEPNRISFWSWFYRSISIIKIHTPFHDAWMNGYIEGFMDYQDATTILQVSSVQPGTFIVRFSDTSPGSLTIVFMGFDRIIRRMQPMDLNKKTALQECATIFLGQLNVKDNISGQKIFLNVYPNTRKEIAFRKFYEWEDSHPTPNLAGYASLSVFLPLSSGPSNDVNATTSNNISGDSDDESFNSDTADQHPRDHANAQIHNYNNYNVSVARVNQSNYPQAQLQPGPQQMDMSEDYYLDIGILPSDIRNYTDN